MINQLSRTKFSRENKNLFRIFLNMGHGQSFQAIATENTFLQSHEKITPVPKALALSNLLQLQEEN